MPCGAMPSQIEKEFYMNTRHLIDLIGWVFIEDIGKNACRKTAVGIAAKMTLYADARSHHLTDSAAPFLFDALDH